MYRYPYLVLVSGVASSRAESVQKSQVNNMAAWQEALLRVYDFPTEQLPRFSYTDRQAQDLIQSGRPVVIVDTDLVAPALQWSTEYLKANIGNGTFSIYQSPTHVFKYFEEKKTASHDDFVPPMQRLDMKFPEFCDRLQTPQSERKYRYYLQQSLNDTVGPQIVRDFVNFNWRWITEQQKQLGWGPLTSNLLLISEKGDVTPCHYDEQENFYAQITGYKRVILFPPEQFACLYPHPVHHPHDRQTQVDFEKPDYRRFPKFREVRGVEAVLGPGDVLYLPSYWFHHFETLLDSETATAITFWYKAAPVTDVQYPLTSNQKMAMMRNIEKMITDALNDHKEVGPFLQTMVLGRYTDDTTDSNSS